MSNNFESLADHSVLVLGGARSGKSRFAEQLASSLSDAKVYIATAEARDQEMRDRIEHHRISRGKEWETVETPIKLCETIHSKAGDGQVLLVDCLTLWLSNLIEAGADIELEGDRLAECIGSTKGKIVLVSNEVGQGIVPVNAMARKFRDDAGLLNQKIAAAADTVYFITAGLPMVLKCQDPHD